MEDMLLRLTNYSSSPMADNIILLITYISFITLMLLPYLSVLNSKKVILGSQSKSRNQLMTAQGLKYTVIPSTFPEDLDKSIYAHPSQYNMDTCMGKVKELTQRFKDQNIDWDLLICGDTILELDNVIIEKPEDQKHCNQMVKQLSGRTHKLYTAHAVIFNPAKFQPKYEQFWVEEAEVTFGIISQQIIVQFAKHPQPYRHSGGYQIAGTSGSFIKSIKGSVSAVEGLDTHAISLRIIEGGKRFGWF